MPRNTKDSQLREDEEVDRDDAEAPRVDENDIEPDDRVPSKLDEEAVHEDLDDDLVEEIDLDEMVAMEGPDAWLRTIGGRTSTVADSVSPSSSQRRHGDVPSAAPSTGRNTATPSSTTGRRPST